MRVKQYWAFTHLNNSDTERLERDGGTRRKRSRDTCLLVFKFGVKHRAKYCYCRSQSRISNWFSVL